MFRFPWSSERARYRAARSENEHDDADTEQFRHVPYRNILLKSIVCHGDININQVRHRTDVLKKRKMEKKPRK